MFIKHKFIIIYLNFIKICSFDSFMIHQNLIQLCWILYWLSIWFQQSLSFNSTLLKRIQLNSWIRINNQSRKMQFYWVALFRLLYSTSLKLYNWIWIINFNCWYSTSLKLYNWIWIINFNCWYSTSLKLYNWIIKFNCWYSIVQFYSTKSKDEQVEGNSLNLSTLSNNERI